MSEAAGSQLMELARSGKITPGGLPGNVLMRTSFLTDPTRVVTNTRFGLQRNIDVLNLSAEDVAFAFAHELGHHRQASTFLGKIVHGFRVRFGFDAEADADAYACSITTHRTGLAGGRCQ